MKVFYVFRHGQTDMNLKKIWQGQSIDCPLNELGRKQALELALKLEKKEIGIIYSSDLKRAFETAEIISKKIGVDVIKSKELREASVGIMEGKSKDEVYAKFPELYSKWRSVDKESFDFGFEGGETKRQCAKRVLNKLEEIAKTSSFENIGISTNGSVIRWISLYFDVPLAFVENCGTVKITYTDRFNYHGFI